ncbi:MAG TPA: hypothetical protein VFA47_07510 [Candidatus Manganitrophaceae bacterium]|nr:hypothetical protein [Candidatus Manganitrophaceae bacterium]
MFSLVLKAKLKALSRILSDEWLTYFLLGPVMVGSLLLLGRRIYADFAAKMGRIEPIVLTDEAVIRFAFALLFLKVFFSFLPLAKRLYPTDRSMSIDDLLPIPHRVRYLFFYLEQLLRDLPLLLFSVFILMILDKEPFLLPAVMIWFFFPAVEIGLTLSWIHWKMPSRAQLFAALVASLLLAGSISVEELGRFFLLVLPILAWAGHWGYGRWRYLDAGRVEESLIQSSGTDWLRRLCRAAPRSIRPLLWRDLLLTYRNFVPLFWRNLILALMLAVATAVRGKLSAAFLCAAAVFILASTASTLFALQRPLRGLDLILPLPLERIWRTKVLYAVLISLPLPWIVWTIEMAVRPLPFGPALFLLFVLVLVGVAVAALTGGTICEGDQKPALHYIIAGFLSVLATLFIAGFHPLLFVLIFPVLNNLRGSAVARLEIEEVA